MNSTSFLDDLKYQFQKGNNAIIQLMIVNVAVFVLINLVYVFFFLFKIDPGFYGTLINFLAVPAHLQSLLFKPWTLFTYMFLHEGVFHILINMLWFYWFGSIFREYLGNKKILPVYVMGGLAGAFLYIISYNIFPVFSNILSASIALGASASVLAIVMATATLLPNYTLYLLFLGPVKLKYIAAFSIILDLLSIPQGNAGGHIAHLGGALFGFLYITRLRKGNDWAEPFYSAADKLKNMFSSKKGPRKVYSSGKMKSKPKQKKKADYDQEKVDDILDKIARSGYDSLTVQEKEFLFRISKKDE